LKTDLEANCDNFVRMSVIWAEYSVLLSGILSGLSVLSVKMGGISSFFRRLFLPTIGRIDKITAD
jgi:hypothetical protein